MSHIYQPVMLMELLKRRGNASRREIASALLQRDESQLEYYERIVTTMVGRVLIDRKIVSKEQDVYSLNGFDELTTSQIEHLLGLCDDKLIAYLEKRHDP